MFIPGKRSITAWHMFREHHESWFINTPDNDINSLKVMYLNGYRDGIMSAKAEIARAVEGMEDK